MTLEAESSVIKYSINRLIMDVGMKAYNHTSLVNNLMLRNIGKIHFDFELDVTPVVRPKAVRISPVIGHLRGSTRQRFNIRVFPCESLSNSRNISLVCNFTQDNVSQYYSYPQ